MFRLVLEPIRATTSRARGASLIGRSGSSVACPAQMEEKSPEPRACALACSGASAPPASGKSGAIELIGPISRITRLIKPRAGLPVIRLVSTVPSSRADLSAARCGGNTVDSGQCIKALPTCTADAPSASAATIPRASDIPPVAITGTLTASTTCGTSAKVPTCVAKLSVKNMPR